MNVDHVATVREARRITRPDPVEWAVLAERAGAHGITCHLRKDRRHISDEDLVALRKRVTTLLNLESSLDAEMLAIGLSSGADEICLVPENRQEITTEGGLDVVADPTAAKRLLGVMPQESDFFDYLTVYQHLRILAKLRGIKPRDAGARADQLIEDLDLVEYRNMTADRLSGGLRRRVLLGIAAIAQPPVMVLDEPTTGLDPQSRRSLWSLLRKYREQGAFVLLTTHSMEEAEALCDRVGIIQGGRVLALDTVANLRANHGFQYKITYFPNGSTSDGVTLYGANDQELVSRVMGMGIQQYSVGQTNLEDVYLAITGGMDGFDDRGD